MFHSNTALQATLNILLTGSRFGSGFGGYEQQWAVLKTLKIPRPLKWIFSWVFLKYFKYTERAVNTEKEALLVNKIIQTLSMTRAGIKENFNKFSPTNWILESQALSFRPADLLSPSTFKWCAEHVKETVQCFSGPWVAVFPCLWGLAVIFPSSYQQIPSPYVFSGFLLCLWQRNVDGSFQLSSFVRCQRGSKFFSFSVHPTSCTATTRSQTICFICWQTQIFKRI